MLIFASTDRFGSSVLIQIRFLKNLVPIGSSKYSVPKDFGINNFGSVSVFPERIEQIDYNSAKYLVHVHAPWLLARALNRQRQRCAHVGASGEVVLVPCQVRRPETPRARDHKDEEARSYGAT